MTKLLTTDDFVYPLFCYLPLILCDFRVLKLQNKGPHCQYFYLFSQFFGKLCKIDFKS